MQFSKAIFSSPLEAAALNPDNWDDVFAELLAEQASDFEATISFYRRPSHATGHRASVSVRRKPECAPVSRLDIPASIEASGPGGGSPRAKLSSPVVEFRCDDEDYGLVATSANRDCLDFIERKLRAMRDGVEFAVKVNRRLLSAPVSLSWPRAILNELSDPAFILTAEGIVEWQNCASSHEGWAEVYTSAPGKPLALLHSTEHASLKSVLASFGDGGVQPAAYVKIQTAHSNKTALMVLKTIEPSFPFSTPWIELFRPRPAVICVLRGWDSKPKLSASSLRQLYELTAKEAELAVGIANGESLRDYAARTGVTFETARWHSKKVMQKMDCRKQQDLLNTLLYRNALFSILE